jgi:hypothetical protein
VRFWYVTVEGGADFRGAKFKDDADFILDFRGPADFSYTVFSTDADWNSRFKSSADFSSAVFNGQTYFNKTRFDGRVRFFGATFSEGAYFHRIISKSDFLFWMTVFNSPVDFSNSILTGNSEFKRVKFIRETNFRGVLVLGRLLMEESEFASETDFRDLRTSRVGLSGCKLGLGIVNLHYSYFHTPLRVLMGGKDTDLGQWLFTGTNIQNVEFVRETWPSNNPCYFQRLLYEPRRKITSDELWVKGDIAVRDDKPSWAEVGAVYRRLRLNYENKLAYDVAGDFHYGQLECRLRERLDGFKENWFKLRECKFRKLRVCFELIGGTLEWLPLPIYKCIFSYGESWRRPFTWGIFGILIVFPLLFWLCRIPPVTGSEIVYAIEYLCPGYTATPWFVSLAAPLIYSIKMAFSLHVPDGLCSVQFIVANLERLYTVVMATFLVLALRRRFKR